MHAEIPYAHFTHGYLPCQYPQGIYSQVTIANDSRMGKSEERQEWVRDIIRTQCKGKITKFAKAIGVSDSYASRMLYPKDKEGYKGIGEDTVKKIMSVFPQAGAPGGDGAVPIFTHERRADDDVTAIQIALESLTVALLKATPGAASAFLADVESIANRRKFSMTQAFLGGLVGIAREVRSDEAKAASIQRRGASARRKKP